MKNKRDSFRRAFSGMCCAAVVAAMVGSSPTAWAQSAPRFQGLPLNPQTDPESPQFDAVGYKKLDSQRRQILIGTAPLDANAIRRWYGLIFSQMTQPDRLYKLPEFRQEMLRDLASAKTDAIHTLLLETIYRGMVTLSQEAVAAGGNNYRLHPAVRYNALLMIGDLNKTEKGIQQPVPVPYKPALGVLVGVLRDPNQPDALKMAALLGIERHAKLDWTAPSADRLTRAQRDGLVAMMVVIAQGSGDPATATDGENWMRRRALETLAALGAVGRVDQVDQLLTSIVANEDASPSLRCTAASVMRFLPDQATIAPAPNANELGGLAVAICKNELEWIKAAQEKELAKKAAAGGAGYGAGGDPYGMGGMPGAPGMGAPGMGAPGMGMGAPGMSGPGMGMGGPPGMGGSGTEGYGDYYGMGEEGGYGMEGYGGYPGMQAAVPEDPRLTLARRRLKYQLVRVGDGLRGVQRVAQSGPDKAKVDKVLQRFDAVMAATDIQEGQDPTLEVLAENVRTAMRELATLTGTTADEESVTDDPIDVGPGFAPTGPAGPGTAPVGPSTTPAAPGTAPPGTAPAGAPTGPAATPAAPAAPAKPAADEFSPVGG